MSYLPEVELSPTFVPFASFQKLFGFVPNLFRAQTLLPRMIEAEAGISAAVLLREGDLSRSQKEYIMLAVAAAHRNTYCFTGHHQRLRLLGIPDRQLDQIAIDHHLAGLSTSEAGLLDFALKLAMNAPWLSREDIAGLRDKGFSDESILEAILVTGLAKLLCTLSTGLDPSPDFEPREIPHSSSPPAPDARSHGGILRVRTCVPWNCAPTAFRLSATL
jgi:uncharacterized peroxidase-related enzyme